MTGRNRLLLIVLFGILCAGFVAFCDSRKAAGHPEDRPHVSSYTHRHQPGEPCHDHHYEWVDDGWWIEPDHDHSGMDQTFCPHLTPSHKLTPAPTAKPQPRKRPTPAPTAKPQPRKRPTPTPESRNRASTPDARKGRDSGEAPSKGEQESQVKGICSSYPHIYIRDASMGQTYRVVHRDGCAYRQWVSQDSPLVYAIPWETVNTIHTVPVQSILSIPLDRVQPWHADNPDTHMLVRRFDGTDERIFVHRDGVWEHVPDLATFVARGYRWQDVCAAGAEFWREIGA